MTEGTRIQKNAIPVISSLDNNHKSDNRKRRSSLILFIIFFLLMLFFSINYFTEIEKDITLLFKIKPVWLLLSITAQVFTYFLTAAIYKQLIKTFEISQQPNMTELFKMSIISLFFNQTIPSAGISGNTFFFNFMNRYKAATFKIIGVIQTELLQFYAALELLILLSIAVILFFTKLNQAFFYTLISGFIVYLVFGCIILLTGSSSFINKAHKKILRSKWLSKIFKNILININKDELPGTKNQLLQIFKRNKIISLKVFLLQLIIIVVDSFTLFALFHGLGIAITLFTTMVCLVSTKIISIIPFLPGSLILYESSLNFFFVKSEIILSAAIIVTLLYRFLSFWLPMPAGLFLYRRWQKNMKPDQSFSKKNL